MSNLSAYGEVLRESLSFFWRDVVPLETNPARELFRSFVLACVRDDFAAKLVNDFNRKAVTRRFFRRHAVRDLREPVLEIFGWPPAANFEADVLWGSFEEPTAFHVVGIPSTAKKLFVSEGDAIARVLLPGKAGYLFLSGYTGELFVFSNGQLSRP